MAEKDSRSKFQIDALQSELIKARSEGEVISEHQQELERKVAEANEAVEAKETQISSLSRELDQALRDSHSTKHSYGQLQVEAIL